MNMQDLSCHLWKADGILILYKFPNIWEEVRMTHFKKLSGRTKEKKTIT
jgi:hypothetical protein